MSLERFRVFARRSVRACPNLTVRELELLPLGAKTITLECGMRFLTDHIDGDLYLPSIAKGRILTVRGRSSSSRRTWKRNGTICGVSSPRKRRRKFKHTTGDQRSQEDDIMLFTNANLFLDGCFQRGAFRVENGRFAEILTDAAGDGIDLHGAYVHPRPARYPHARQFRRGLLRRQLGRSMSAWQRYQSPANGVTRHCPRDA